MNKRWKLTPSIFLAMEFAYSIALAQPAAASSQDIAASEEGARIELLEAQQKEKALHLQPARPDKAEEAVAKYIGDNPLTKYFNWLPGLRLRLGGMPSGAGFSLGPEYFRPDLARGQVSFRTSAVGSTKQWYMIDTELRFPHLAQRYLDMGLLGRHLDANSLDYYGPGPDSQKDGRSDYRLEESGLDFSMAFKPTRRHLSVGFTAGYLWYNVGPGRAGQFISSEKQYPASVTPGIDRQTNYLRAGPFLEFDSRDKPKDPHTGTYFLVKYNRLSDRKLDQFSFKQIYGSIEQYFPFFNQKRVLALRLRSILSYPDAGNAVPFYVQPTLGGTSDLRGYRRYRFHDNNSFLIDAEYRWEVFTLMDAAVFADAGEVFHRDRDFDLGRLETDVGFGLRFKTRQAVVFRVDTAFSHEGYGLWLTFDHVF